MAESTDTVLVAGHLCVDITPQFESIPHFEPGRLADIGPAGVRLGGCVANTGRALAALGVPVRASALLGADALARLGRTLADHEPFGADRLSPVEGATTSYSIVLESAHADRMFWHHAGANDLFDGSAVDLDGVTILHVGYPSLLAATRADAGAKLVALFERARARSVVTSLDLAVVSPGADDLWGKFFDAVLPLTDVVSPSIDDLRSVAPSVDESWDRIGAAEAAADLVARGAAVALVTAGASGLHLVTGSPARIRASGTALATLGGWSDQRVSVEAPRSPRRVTTNGAGDAASAGLLAGIHRRLDPRSAAELAATAASAAIAGELSPGFTPDAGGQQ